MFAGCSCFEVDAFLKRYFCLLHGNGILLLEQVGTKRRSRAALGLDTAPVPSWHFSFHLLGIGYH